MCVENASGCRHAREQAEEQGNSSSPSENERTFMTTGSFSAIPVAKAIIIGYNTAGLCGMPKYSDFGVPKNDVSILFNVHISAAQYIFHKNRLS